MRRIGTTPLWIGHVGDVRDLRAIHRAGILAMVDLAVNEAPATVNREMVYCRFPLVDGAGNGDAILRTAIDTVANLLRADVPTLVYCSAGMSRSVAVGAAGLARATGRSPKETLSEVTHGGPADVSSALWDAVLRAWDGGVSR
jgi:hypothetical protein